MESIVMDILVSPVLQRLSNATAALAKEQFSSLMGVEEEIENLSKHLLLIQQVIKDAEENPLKKNEVGLWLRDLRNSAYDAEDILDEFATEASLQPMKGATTKGFMGKKLSPLIGEEQVEVLVRFKAVLQTSFLSCFSTSSPNIILRRLKITNDIFRSSVEVALKNKSELQLQTESPSSTGEQPAIPTSSKGEDGPLLEAQFELIGRDDVRDEIGWEIIAAEVVGRTLCGNSDENKWKSFLENKEWIGQSESTEGIMSNLRWSYRHLPSHLKQCFMYCSIFPKDFLFDKEDLVLKWMAIGFVQPKGTRRLEEIGGTYFDDLLYRSFFEITNGEYKMDDLIHDLAQSLSQDECKTVTDEVKFDGTLGNVRHLSFACNQEEKHNAALQECKKSRTIWIQNHSLPKNSFTNLRCMRVLDLYSNKIEELPDTIGELKLLRYLNIGWCIQLRSLPESMCNLYNLQTLKMEGCHASLPTGMSKLINLRHLKAREDLVSQVAGIGKLASLQNLGLFDVSTESGRRISELRDMKELRGSLTIKRLQHVGSGNEAAEANMKEKRHLEELILRWDLNSNTTSKREEVLDALKPHAGLKLLEISDYVGFQPPSWMVEVTGLKSLRLLDCKQLTDVEVPVSLEELKLQGCDMLRSIPPLHQLTKIKILDIRWCAKLTITDHVKEEEAAMSFPSLKYLAIDVGVLLSKILRRYDLIGLEEMQITTYLPQVEDEEGSRWQRLISLQKLGLHDCHVLLPLVHWIPSLKHLEITGRRGLPSMAEVRLPNSLEILTVKDWDNLLALPEELHCLPSLRELLIKGCSQIHSMAEYRLPSSLKVLSFIHCKQLSSLPAELHRLPSLRKLELLLCKQLQSLPEGGLPESLRELKMKDCPILQKRCQKDGPDWPKIKHIPNISSRI